MSMKRMAILYAVSNNNNNSKNLTEIDKNNNLLQQQQSTNRPNGTNFHGNVNVLLGGAMLSVVITVICFVCYCCHRNLKKRSESVYRQRWLETDPNMEIYSVEQCYDISTNLVNDSGEATTCSSNMGGNSINCQQGPPPSYETVVSQRNQIQFLKCNVHSNHMICPFMNESMKLKCDMEWQQLDGGGGGGGGSNECELLTKEQILNVCNINRIHHLGCCCDNELHRSYEFVKKCKRCGKEIDCFSPLNSSTDNDDDDDACKFNEDEENGNGKYCNCYTLAAPPAATSSSINHLCLTNNTEELENNEPIEFATNELNGNESENLPSTSSSFQCGCSINNNIINNNNNETIDVDNNENIAQVNQLSICNTNNNNPSNSATIDFDTFNENGLIRMDMSQIIDHTGLPTYEAALKLESSGYV